MARGMIRESSLLFSLELCRKLTQGRVYTSKHVPTAMIFVRCRDGVSHNPAEYSRPEDCAAGAQVLLGAYLRYDDYIRQKHTSGASDAAVKEALGAHARVEITA